jgi:hypothetical protein
VYMFEAYKRSTKMPTYSLMFGFHVILVFKGIDNEIGCVGVF